MFSKGSRGPLGVSAGWIFWSHRPSGHSYQNEGDSRLNGFSAFNEAHFIVLQIFSSVSLACFILWLEEFSWWFLSAAFIFKFIYLFISASGLNCCARAFSSYGEQGLLFIVVHGLHGLLIAVASLVAGHGL